MNDTTIDVLVIDTTDKSEKELNQRLDKLPPIVDVIGVGKFLVVKYESMLNRKGQWDRYASMTENSFQNAAK